MKLGYIDYLNCYPFYFHMFERAPLASVEIVPRNPSVLNTMLGHGEIDMSAISAGSIGDMEESIRVLPDFCLSSLGYVHSVLLRSKLPIEELDGKQVGITRTSRTSEVLLKVLLERYYYVRPVYGRTEPNPSFNGIDAALIIGNEAMTAPPQLAPFTYDLGELWLRKTGFPVVFAVFAVREKAVEQFRRQIEATIGSYKKSLQCLTDEEDIVVRAACARYPYIIYDVRSYYHLFQFNFTDQLKAALRFYIDSATELGIFDKEVEVNYLAPFYEGSRP